MYVMHINIHKYNSNILSKVRMVAMVQQLGLAIGSMTEVRAKSCSPPKCPDWL
jgi:hypothetical protein